MDIRDKVIALLQDIVSENESMNRKGSPYQGFGGGRKRKSNRWNMFLQDFARQHPEIKDISQLTQMASDAYRQEYGSGRRRRGKGVRARGYIARGRKPSDWNQFLSEFAMQHPEINDATEMVRKASTAYKRGGMYRGDYDY